MILSLPSAFPFLSVLKSYLSLSSSNRLSSEVVASPNPIKATHLDCNPFLGICLIKILKVSLLPNPSHFNLFQCQLPISILYSTAIHISLPFLHSPYLPPSKLFMNPLLLLALIYTPFSFLCNFQTSFFCFFISSSQHFLPSSLLSLNRSFYLIVPLPSLFIPSSYSH